MSKLFGTDGVRGIANSELTCDLAFKIGQAGALVLTKRCKTTPEIVVGKDTRISGDMLESSLLAGFCSVGANAVRLGIIPTPAVAYLTRMYGADAGVVISASHNSMEYNGIKFFDGKGFKLSDEIEEEIEDIVLNSKLDFVLPAGENIGKITNREDAYLEYVKFVKQTIDCNLSGIKIAVDCANGATYKVAQKVFGELGAELYIINNTPNGININEKCGSTYMAGLQNLVRNTDCDIGVAFDGDGDRVLATDEKGILIDGDQIMAICAFDMKKRGILKNNTLVGTVMSNLGLKVATEKLDIEFKQTAVGDRYVLEQMLKTGENLGGEQSGHIVFMDYNTTGDGVLAALQLLAIMKRSGKKLSELAGIMKVFPQVMINAYVVNEKKKLFDTDYVIKEKVAEISEKYSKCGRVLIRPSGTEPVIRVMIEGEDSDLITKDAKMLAKLIENRLA